MTPPVSTPPDRARTAASKDKKTANRLLALGSAAVLIVYAAGYDRTRASALQFRAAAERRPLNAPVVERALQAPSRPSAPAETRGEAARTAFPSQPPAAIAHTTTPASKQSAAAADESVGVTIATVAPPVTAELAPAPPPSPTPAPVATEAASAAPPQPVEAQPTAPAKSGYKDGTYLGWGTSRHGDIQAAVVIEDGKITSAKIVQCLTRYSCSWIEHLPGQVISRQSAEVDYVSGATQSSDAYFQAISEALDKARG